MLVWTLTCHLTLLFGINYISNLVESRLDLTLELTALDPGAGVALEVADVFDRPLDDLCLLDAALLEVAGGDQSAQVCQAVVHPVPPPLLDDLVGQRVLGNV